MIKPMMLSQIAELVGGVHRGDDVAIHSVSTDSRNMPDQALFVALRGEKFDGNQFVEGAKQRGAVAALVSSPSTHLPCVEVVDTRKALGIVARENRRAYSGPVIALTGSSGKTSTKELLAAILSEEGPVLATRGNLNNEIGLPLTLL
ncbi:MAG: Mur ligase domain-containing protein, partial [Spongiibacter sp.]